jgi:hypothetical protein
MDAATNLLPIDGEAYVVENFFPEAQSQVYFEILQRTVEWKQEPIRMFGKLIMQPRLTALLGDPLKAYRYSGITMVPQFWPDQILELKEKI